MLPKWEQVFLTLSMNKVTSTIIRQIYFYKKHNGRDVYHIGIQCRNGHHRSVDIAENLSLYFSTDVYHYDLNNI